jgi:hypothetical protein
VTGPTWINIMGVSADRMSRWDRGDGATAITALEGALERAGLPGQLEAPKRLLARAEDLAAQARDAKMAARARLEEASRLLLADGPIDTDAYAATLVACGPWLHDGEASAMFGLMQAAQMVRGNATQTVFAMAPGLHTELQKVCRVVVEETASVPALPADVWSAPSSGGAAQLAIVAGREADWARLVRAGDRWDSVHSAAQLLRECGVFQSELAFSGPTDVCVTLLNWSDAMDGLPEVNRMPPPLRLRAAIDRGWRPGLWLKSDHDRFAAEAAEVKPKRGGLFAALAGKSQAPADPAAAVGSEFSAG